MGEAKLRGSFEERKAMAVERERKARKERAEREREAQKERAKREALRPKGTSRFDSLLSAALAFSADSFFSKK